MPTLRSINNTTWIVEWTIGSGWTTQFYSEIFWGIDAESKAVEFMKEVTR